MQKFIPCRNYSHPRTWRTPSQRLAVVMYEVGNRLLDKCLSQQC